MSSDSAKKLEALNTQYEALLKEYETQDSSYLQAKERLTELDARLAAVTKLKNEAKQDLGQRHRALLSKEDPEEVIKQLDSQIKQLLATCQRHDADEEMLEGQLMMAEEMCEGARYLREMLKNKIDQVEKQMKDLTEE